MFGICQLTELPIRI